MFAIKFILKVVTTFTAIALIASCTDSEALKAEPQNSKVQAVIMDVYKSPTCGCCTKWIDHLEVNGFQSNIHDRKDISTIKDEKNIAPRYRSCHTAISKEGYIFEGHIPAKFIQQFLQETHADNVLGLAVPAMPLGSPGMEVGDKFHPYKVLLLTSDGNYEIYANVQSYKEQF
ncbi:MAG: DUF411 domain-containing protein [Colwellia sp.]|nr:DUF411 domain-containing protein [Colwellia sp.]